MRLKDRVAIVTGAGDGIGRGTALAFAKEGAGLAVCDIDRAALRHTETLVRQAGANLFAACFDIREVPAIAQFVDSTASVLGRIDILVNNAAVMPVSSLDALDERTVDDVIDVNVKAAIFFSKHVVPHMQRAGGGSIIHMSSVTGHNGFPGVVVYGATKGALMALARGQAMELAKDRIRVNTVSPGTVDSPMLHRFLQREADSPVHAREEFDRIHPRGTIASIEEVAATVLFLASDESINITATDIRCDGGFCVQGRQPRS